MYEISQKYLHRNAESFNAKNSLLEVTYPFSISIQDQGFEFIRTVVEEVKEFCHQEGYTIDRVSFMSLYDADLHSEPSSTKMESDTALRIIETRSGEKEAVLFLGSYVEHQ